MSLKALFFNTALYFHPFFLTFLNLLAKSILCLLGGRDVPPTLLTAKALVKYSLYMKKMISQGMQGFITNGEKKIFNPMLVE